jgi:hypothetical protein
MWSSTLNSQSAQKIPNKPLGAFCVMISSMHFLQILGS